MHNDPMSMMRSRIINLAQKGKAQARKIDQVRYESTFKQPYPNYTVGDFLQDIVACGETYESVLEQLNVYDRHRAWETIEEACLYAELMEMAGISDADVLNESNLMVERRDRFTKDIAALRDIMKMRKAAGDKLKDNEKYQQARKEFIKTQRTSVGSFGRKDPKRGFMSWIKGEYRPDPERIKQAVTNFLTKKRELSVPAAWQAAKKGAVAATSSGVAAASQIPSAVRSLATRGSPEPKRGVVVSGSEEAKKAREAAEKGKKAKTEADIAALDRPVPELSPERRRAKLERDIESMGVAPKAKAIEPTESETETKSPATGGKKGRSLNRLMRLQAYLTGRKSRSAKAPEAKAPEAKAPEAKAPEANKPGLPPRKFDPTKYKEWEKSLPAKEEPKKPESKSEPPKAKAEEPTLFDKPASEEPKKEKQSDETSKKAQDELKSIVGVPVSNETSAGTIQGPTKFKVGKVEGPTPATPRDQDLPKYRIGKFTSSISSPDSPSQGSSSEMYRSRAKTPPQPVAVSKKLSQEIEKTGGAVRTSPFAVAARRRDKPSPIPNPKDEPVTEKDVNKALSAAQQREEARARRARDLEAKYRAQASRLGDNLK